MSYELREGLSFCMPEGRPVFLDVKRDRYFALNTKQTATFLKLLQGNLFSAGDETQIEILRQKGVLTKGNRQLLACQISSPVHDETYLRAQQCSSLRRLPAFCWHLLVTLISLRLLGLDATIQRPRPKPAKLNPDVRSLSLPYEVTEMLAAYHWSGLISGSHNRCLWRSLALARWLRSKNVNCNLVMGVSVRPFSAHCWVQVGGEVLNDTCENVHNFVPIFAG